MARHRLRPAAPGHPQTIISIDYRVEISEPKTARGRRSVALDAGTVTALRAHRASQNQEKLILGEAYQDVGLVFCRADGTPVHPDRLTQMFDKHVKDSGIPRIRLHDLRHTHATLALAAGIHPKVVSERLGHSTVAFTMDVYSHAIPSMEAEAAETIANLVRGTNPAQGAVVDRADQEAALRWAFTEKHVFYRLHALLEMAEDDVTAELVVGAGCNCEVLEEYTGRREGRTKLLLGYLKGDEPLHVVVNVQRFENDFEARLEVVTVYRPRPPKWTDERTRGMR